MIIMSQKTTKSFEQEYVVVEVHFSDYICDGAETVLNNDDLMPDYDDDLAIFKAKSDGICFINDITCVPKDVYIDNKHNRNLLPEIIRFHQEIDINLA